MRASLVRYNTHEATSYMPTVKPGQHFRHYKGNEYEVIGVAKHTETDEEFVAYRADQGSQLWVRPLAMFFEEVEWQGKRVPRFAEVFQT